MLTSLTIAESITRFGDRGFIWFAPLVSLLLVAAIVVLIVLLVRSRNRLAAVAQNVSASDAGRAAEATLGERFAQGDMDEVEYRARLEVLRANRPTPPNA